MSHDDDDKTSKPHSGAKIKHDSPFADLSVPALNYEESDKELTESWVAPLYLGGLRDEGKMLSVLGPLKDRTDTPLIERLISLRDWRPRLVGGHLAALRKETTLVDWLGRLLVRSDVCYAAPGYCYALASINTTDSIDYLEKYLDYYLEQPDLWFDQQVALAALSYADEVNGTELAAKYAERWTRFVENKPNWDLERSRAAFREGMSRIERVAVALGWQESAQ